MNYVLAISWDSPIVVIGLIAAVVLALFLYKKYLHNPRADQGGDEVFYRPAFLPKHRIGVTKLGIDVNSYMSSVSQASMDAFDRGWQKGQAKRVEKGWTKGADPSEYLAVFWKRADKAPPVKASKRGQII